MNSQQYNIQILFILLWYTTLWKSLKKDLLLGAFHSTLVSISFMLHLGRIPKFSLLCFLVIYPKNRNGISYNITAKLYQLYLTKYHWLFYIFIHKLPYYARKNQIDRELKILYNQNFTNMQTYKVFINFWRNIKRCVDYMIAYNITSFFKGKVYLIPYKLNYTNGRY